MRYFKIIIVQCLVIFSLFGGSFILAKTANKDILLNRPTKQVDLDIIEALNLRKSTRKFENREIAIDQIASILWAANGVNRENGKKTAPSAFGKDLINVYLVSNKGIYLYLPLENKLKFISDKNIKNKIAKQKYVETASHILLLTGDLSQVSSIASGDQGGLILLHSTAGCVAENVYLISGAFNIGTCLVHSINEEAIKNSIPLKDKEIPLLIMPLGYISEDVK